MANSERGRWAAHQDQLLDAIWDMDKSEAMKTFIQVYAAWGEKQGAVARLERLMLFSVLLVTRIRHDTPPQSSGASEAATADR